MFEKKMVVILAVAVIAGVAIGYFAFVRRPHWQTNADEAATGVDEKGHPWFGAKNPKVIIHEYLDYECPHCTSAHRVLRSVIARDLDEVRIVRHDYARTPCVQKVGDETTMLCPMVRAASCAAKHISYWKWNDMLMAQPRHETDKGIDVYLADMVTKLKLPEAEFQKCFDSVENAEKAQKLYLETRDAKVSATPTYIVNDKVYTPSELFEMLETL
ncbi:MAG: DsbA family protein [Deltaproteobacteria bacterium]|nr:DsbA family protein [Deltaproteobacteria bacterium]